MELHETDGSVVTMSVEVRDLNVNLQHFGKRRNLDMIYDSCKK